MCKRLCILAAPCMLAAGIQAEADADTPGWGAPFAEAAIRNNIDIHLLPCGESYFSGLEAGLARKKHGIDYYACLPGYLEYCEMQAAQTAETIAILQKRYQIIAIVGVEHSPNCAVNYLYSHCGMRKEPGLFMRKLMDHLTRMQIQIPFLGVNRKYPRKSLLELEAYIREAKAKESESL